MAMLTSDWNQTRNYGKHPQQEQAIRWCSTTPQLALHPSTPDRSPSCSPNHLLRHQAVRPVLLNFFLSQLLQCPPELQLPRRCRQVPERRRLNCVASQGIRVPLVTQDLRVRRARDRRPERAHVRSWRENFAWFLPQRPVGHSGTYFDHFNSLNVYLCRYYLFFSFFCN